tara:strand:+ start:213 stop:599 length:387 start_codon:yes stop_codon:yes gene_type:complete
MNGLIITSTQHLEKVDNLKQETILSTAPIPNLKNANFTVHSHDTKSEKMVIAYDVGGNAIECSIEDILEKKYKPKPDWGITEEDSKNKEELIFDSDKDVEESQTRSGKCFRLKPRDPNGGRKLDYNSA